MLEKLTLQLSQHIPVAHSASDFSLHVMLSQHGSFKHSSLVPQSHSSSSSTILLPQLRRSIESTWTEKKKSTITNNSINKWTKQMLLDTWIISFCRTIDSRNEMSRLHFKKIQQSNELKKLSEFQMNRETINAFNLLRLQLKMGSSKLFHVSFQRTIITNGHINRKKGSSSWKKKVEKNSN